MPLGWPLLNAVNACLVPQSGGKMTAGGGEYPSDLGRIDATATETAEVMYALLNLYDVMSELHWVSTPRSVDIENVYK